MIEDILKLGMKLLENQVISRNEIREASKTACNDLLSAHCLSLGVIHSMYSQFLGIPGKTDSSISARLPLIASFVQGIDLCEIAINEGLYTQAATLLKQELETIAAVNECKRGNRKNRKTPNIQFTKFGLSKEYGFLNGIGHVSDKDLFEALFKATPDEKVEDQQPVEIQPLFNEKLCVHFYAMHIILILQVIDQLKSLFFDMYDFHMSDELNDALSIVYTKLCQAGLLVDEPEADSK